MATGHLWRAGAVAPGLASEADCDSAEVVGRSRVRRPRGKAPAPGVSAPGSGRPIGVGIDVMLLEQLAEFTAVLAGVAGRLRDVAAVRRHQSWLHRRCARIRGRPPPSSPGNAPEPRPPARPAGRDPPVRCGRRNTGGSTGSWRSPARGRCRASGGSARRPGRREKAPASAHPRRRAFPGNARPGGECPPAADGAAARRRGRRTGGSRGRPRKRSGSHQLLDGGVGGRHDANVGRPFRAADGTIDAFLAMAAQQGAPALAREAVDLVQEQSSLLGLSDQAFAPGVGVGEGAALVAEQLGSPAACPGGRRR